MTKVAEPLAEDQTSAIRKRSIDRPTLLAFKIVGKISKSDIEGMARRIEAAFDAYGQIDFLLLMTDFEGMDAGASFDREAVAAQTRSIRHVRKYGVVGAPAWARAMIEFLIFSRLWTQRLSISIRLATLGLDRRRALP